MPDLRTAAAALVKLLDDESGYSIATYDAVLADARDAVAADAVLARPFIETDEGDDK